MSTSRGRPVDIQAEVPAARPSAVSYLQGWGAYFLEYLPGLALLAALAGLAKLLGHVVSDSYCVLFAILAGVLARNLFGLSCVFEPGTRTYEIFWKTGIVLLGSQMGLQSFGEVGLRGLGLAGIEIFVVIVCSLFLTKIFRIPAPLRYLLAIGLGVCGVSAGIALAFALHADEEDTGYAVTVILLWGVVMLGLLPALGKLMQMSDLHFGLWAGYSVNNTAEAVATGFIYSETAGHYATLAKLSRNLFLGVALLYFVQRAAAVKFSLGGRTKWKEGWRYFPKFALGLLLFSVMATVHFWSSNSVLELAHLYRWAFLFGFAGVGLRTDLRRLRHRGMKPLAFALGVQAVLVITLLGCVLLVF